MWQRCQFTVKCVSLEPDQAAAAVRRAQHTDLHPGNILVRVRRSPGSAAQRAQQQQRQQQRGGGGARLGAPGTPRSLDELLAQGAEGGKAKNALQLVRWVSFTVAPKGLPGLLRVMVC